MKLIKTGKDHAVALQRLEGLMVADPDPASPEGEELELLAFLIEDYEKRTIEIPPASPAEAIRFRMEQGALKQQDLVAFIGSKSRVSEVLSGKRDLTLAMVRKLHEGLGIPLKSLVLDDSAELPPRIEPDDYPTKEMFLRGYFAAAFGTKWSTVKDRAEELLQGFFDGRQDEPIGAFNRRTTVKKFKVDLGAIHAWRCRVLDNAAALQLPPYDSALLSDAFVRQLTALSPLSNGPLLVRQRLQEAGVAVIIEEHLPKTRLDGAAMWHPDGFPVIALTLRYDRLDNFWFTLFHELGHVIKHLESSMKEGFLDTDIDGASEKKIEIEADRFALEAFISQETWDNLSSLRLKADIVATAKELAIHPAVIAGRLRREAGDYRKHRTLIEQGHVRNLFQR
jgi:HTH-type transcriptional regulator/antitoxin HigA